VRDDAVSALINRWWTFAAYVLG